MEFTFDNIIIICSLLLFVSLLASRSVKLGVPFLVVFLAVGMLIGTESIGGIKITNINLMRNFSAIALSFILFSGGLDTKLDDVRPILLSGFILSTLGVLLTCVAIGLFAHWTFDMPIIQAMLLGAIVSSTDVASAFNILRSRKLALKGRLRPILEFESGCSAPVSYFLTIVLIGIAQTTEVSFQAIISQFLQQIALGAIVGFAAGFLMQHIFNWIHFDYDGLYSVLMIAMILAIIGITDILGGNAFLAVYASACTLGNRHFVRKRSLTKQMNGLAWLMQIALLICMGMLIKPSACVDNYILGVSLALVLIFVARPLTIFICLLPFKKINYRAKMLVSWAGLHGVSPLVFAVYPWAAGLPYAGQLFVVTFFVSVISLLLQGPTIPFVARKLNVLTPLNRKRRSTLDIEMMSWKNKSEMRCVKIEPDFNCVGKEIVKLKLPNSIVIATIRRNGKYFISDGRTRLAAGDELFVLTDDQSDFEDLMHCLTTYE